MTDAERIQRFQRNFTRLRRNREKVSMSLLATRYAKTYNALVSDICADADWFADSCLDILAFPRHPDDPEGNAQLGLRISTILRDESKPGGMAERMHRALIDDLNWDAYEQLVWERYERLEREAFMPYWTRHCYRTGPPENRWIWNDIFRKFWWPKTAGYPESGCWINNNYTGNDYRYPPSLKGE